MQTGKCVQSSIEIATKQRTQTHRETPFSPPPYIYAPTHTHTHTHTHMRTFSHSPTPFLSLFLSFAHTPTPTNALAPQLRALMNPPSHTRAPGNTYVHHLDEHYSRSCRSSTRSQLHLPLPLRGGRCIWHRGPLCRISPAGSKFGRQHIAFSRGGNIYAGPAWRTRYGARKYSDRRTRGHPRARGGGRVGGEATDSRCVRCVGCQRKQV